MILFQYHPAILDRYPDLVGGVILARGLSNGPTTDDLRRAYRAEQQAVLARIGTTPLSQIPSLAAWRGVFRDFGVDPTQYRSAVEALLRRLTKRGEIPSINALVDACNLISIRYALPVAAFDQCAVEGAITVRFATGDESFTPLGQSEVERPDQGEVVFADEGEMVLARRWCWRQSAESATGPESRSALITIEAQHTGSRPEVEAAVGDAVTLLKGLAEQTASALLDPTSPRFEPLV
jgi:DNA/RNA-binding domain of Phe-tRNA-synthetase-like protein